MFGDEENFREFDENWGLEGFHEFVTSFVFGFSAHEGLQGSALSRRLPLSHRFWNSGRSS